MNAKASALKSKVIGTVSDVLSGPSRLKHAIRGARADADRKVLKLARGYDDAPNRNLDGSISEAFKVRSVADSIRNKYKNK